MSAHAVASRSFDARPRSEATGSGSSRRSIRASVGMPLLQAFFRKIIRKGPFNLIRPDGHNQPIVQAPPSLTNRITNSTVIPKLLTNPDLALGEAYMNGALVIEGGDIYDFLDLCFANLGWSSGHWMRRLRSMMQRLGRHITQHNPISVARANVAHHYDLSDTLFELFLAADRQYSCAYYKSSAETLERAQAQKKTHIAAKLLLRPGPVSYTHLTLPTNREV